MITPETCSTTSLSTSAPAQLTPPQTTPQVKSAGDGDKVAGTGKVLCDHCGRTADNGVTCQGMCVADSDY